MVTTQFAPASADCYESNDCGFSLCDCDPCDGWSVYADWLYWRTRKCDLDYAISINDDIFDKLHSVCLDWDSGFRVGVLKACGDVDFGIHYTSFNTSASSYELDLIQSENNFDLLGTRLGGFFYFW